MDTEIDAPDLEELEAAEEQEQEQPEGEAPEPEAAEEEDAPLVVTFGDDEPEEQEVAKAPEWVRELRRQNAEAKKRIRELEAEKNAVTGTVTIGPKPTLESCDYDPELFEQRLNTWLAENAKADAARDEQRRAEQAQQEAFERKVAAYNEAKAKLPVPDFEDAEAVLIDTFDATQQGLLVKVAKQPAIFAYGLGKNPSRAKALAAIKDPVDFIAEAVRMELEMKQQSGKRVPAPEKRVTGGGVAGAASTDSTLERLRDEAARTGDYTKVNAYKRQLRK